MFAGRIAWGIVLLCGTVVLGQGEKPVSAQGNPDQATGYQATPPNAVIATPVSLGDPIDLTDPNSPPPMIAARVPRDQAGGAQMSEQVARSRVIEEYKSEKFLVYPDDPQSAWWETNVRYAFARAQREMKPLLLLFTAVWRPEAMNLSEEVFATKSFNNYVKENLVICYLNYPPNIKDAPRSMQWAKKEFKVAGYPSVLIFNPYGEVERSLRGYRKGRPVDYFNNLKGACAPALSLIAEQKKNLERRGYRDWRNPEGRTLFAKFVRREELLMTLRDGRGQEWTIAIKQLIPDDQALARSFPRIDQVSQP